MSHKKSAEEWNSQHNLEFNRSWHKSWDYECEDDGFGLSLKFRFISFFSNFKKKIETGPSVWNQISNSVQSRLSNLPKILLKSLFFIILISKKNPSMLPHGHEDYVTFLYMMWAIWKESREMCLGLVLISLRRCHNWYAMRNTAV
jgi:hypothetical protein